MTQAERILADIARHADNGVGVREAITRVVDSVDHATTQVEATMQQSDNRNRNRTIDERASERAFARKREREATRNRNRNRNRKAWEVRA